MPNIINESSAKAFISFDIGQPKNSMFAICCSGDREVSRLYEFHLHIATHSTGLEWLLSGQDVILGKPCLISISSGIQHKDSLLHGIIDSISINTQQATAELTVVPSLKLLCYTQQSRIFEKQSHLKTVNDLIQTHCNNHYFKIDTESVNHTAAPTIEYIVQHQESDFAFMQRLLSEAGLMYYFSFDHHCHTMHIVDSFTPGLQPPIITIDGNTSSNQNITQLSIIKQAGPKSISMNDYNPDYPNRDLNVSSTLQGIATDEYIYPGGYQDKDQGQQYLNLRIKRNRSKQERQHGTSQRTDLYPGLCFSDALGQSLSADNYYLITRHTFKAIAHHNFKDHAERINHYTCEFDLTNDIVNYQPSIMFKKPTFFGIETATVITDQTQSPACIDELGRIKIRFHWDIKQSHQSQAYIRVMQTIAGKHRGHVFTPRAGQEVWVMYLNGDIDRPIIIGSAYNSTHRPPYDRYTSGMRFESINQHKEDSSRINELKWSNQSGKELVCIQAQRNYTEIVNNDATSLIKGNWRCDVNSGNMTHISHQGGIHLQATKKITIECGKSCITLTPNTISLSSPTIQLNPGSNKNQRAVNTESESQNAAETIYSMTRRDLKQ